MQADGKRVLLLDADDNAHRNFLRACSQIEAEHGKNASHVFAFEYGRLGSAGIRRDSYVFEEAASRVGYTVDWHGVKHD